MTSTPATGTGRPQLPDRAAFWRWVYEAVRPLLGWLLVVLGAVSLLLGYIGVSGESLTAQRLPAGRHRAQSG